MTETPPLHVVVAGGGVAALETVMALRDVAVPADGDVVVGQPGQALQVLSMQVDLLVCGTHGWRGCFDRLIPGSTAEWVAHHAGCPVVVTPLAPVRETALAG